MIRSLEVMAIVGYLVGLTISVWSLSYKVAEQTEFRKSIVTRVEAVHGLLNAHKRECRCATQEEFRRF